MEAISNTVLVRAEGALAAIIVAEKEEPEPDWREGGGLVLLPCTRGRGEERGKSGMFLDSCLNKQMGVGVSARGREQRNRLQGMGNKKSVSVIMSKFGVMCDGRLITVLIYTINIPDLMADAWNLCTREIETGKSGYTRNLELEILFQTHTSSHRYIHTELLGIGHKFRLFSL